MIPLRLLLKLQLKRGEFNYSLVLLRLLSLNPHPPSLRLNVSPLLGAHLLFRDLHFLDNEFFGELDEFIRAARIENGVRLVADVLADVIGVDASVASIPNSGETFFRSRAGAGDVKFEVRIRPQFLKFVAEDDVFGHAHAIENRDFCFRALHIAKSNEAAEGG